MQAVLSPASRARDVLSSVPRGRTRAVSDAYPPPQPHREPERVQLPKAASYTYFPKVNDLDDSSMLELKGKISEEELKGSEIGDTTSYSSSDGSSPDSEHSPQTEQDQGQEQEQKQAQKQAQAQEEQQEREQTQPQEPRPSISRRSSRFLPFSKNRASPSDSKPDHSRNEKVKQAESSASSSPVRSLTQLRRKSWISTSSRPSSPTKEGRKKDNGSPVKQDDTKKSQQARESQTTPKGRVLTKKSKRLSGLFNGANSEESIPPPSSVPAVPPVPKSFSTDKLPHYAQSARSPNHMPPLPRNLSSEKLKGVKTEPRKKDELWTVFRTLEGDLRKFQSKSLALKANVLRTTLLPFLRTYASHPSNHRLRPEDLDRRANILNGWWTGMLELLAGRNNQSISGTDRPAILEGIAGIMERPEWRLSPSPFCALADRVETSSTTTAKSTGSNSSNSSDFLAESVCHNVRNIFTQNLQSQMAFVIDKMALRNAAASLVTFCGKTCAYAFCFCPGVANVLVRLWDPSLDMMKRVLSESGVSRQDKLDSVSDRIVASFPPALQNLKFQSLTKLVRSLRQPASLPLGTGHVDWYGSWVKRWSGAESDLFYVFTKHYHILATDFLPAEPSDAERVCVPGLVIVHAQILVNLDATINRHAAPSQPEAEPANGAASVTFDDVLADPDASASTVPIPPANATRQMQENRLIMLIRDFLSERNANVNTARRIFAESFSRLLKGAARKVSIFDNNACYTLCDFLEEAFIILVRYEQLDTEHSILGWPFWLSVFKKMTLSHNTATEIKLYAFLYSTWSTITCQEERKASLCLDFLLEPEFFESRFNHWCPMVRSYFMRLLCWRVARFDGEESKVRIEIMIALSDRLRSVWSHYMWLRDEAERKQALPPSTQACNPAPGRRFLIIRNDNPIVTNTGPFISFDGVVQSPGARRLSSTSSNAPPEPEIRPVSAASADSHDFPDEDQGKITSRWGFLRTVIGASRPATKSRSPGPVVKEKENSKPSAASAAKGSGDASQTVKAPAAQMPSPPIPHRSFSFRFSLEWVDKRFGQFQNMRLQPPRLPLPAHAHLQTKDINMNPVDATKPTGPAATSSTYSGRALAEWTFISHECQNFFDRRKNEGVPSNKQVETPTLAVEAFRRPG